MPFIFFTQISLYVAYLLGSVVIVKVSPGLDGLQVVAFAVGGLICLGNAEAARKILVRRQIFGLGAPKSLMVWIAILFPCHHFVFCFLSILIFLIFYRYGSFLVPLSVATGLFSTVSIAILLTEANRKTT